MEEDWRRFERAARDLFEITLGPAQLELLSRYADLIDAWAARINLVSTGSRSELLYRHLLDSLAPSLLLAGTRAIVDLGSGAGLPGIPLAIARPELSFVLLESRRRRVT